MAVVIGLSENGARIYRSVNGIHVSPEERECADLLDTKVEYQFKSLENKLTNNGAFKQKEKVKVYWEYGNLINSLLNSSGLVQAELPYFFENVKLHVPDSMKPKDRGPNRQHIKYCYRLGKYDQNTALKLKWSEWSYLFDSASINAEERFDSWFNNELSKKPELFDRNCVRLLGKTLNTMLRNIETSDLSDEEIENCYHVTEQFCETAKRDEFPSNVSKKLKVLSQNKNFIIRVMNGSISGEDLYERLE